MEAGALFFLPSCTRRKLLCNFFLHLLLRLELMVLHYLAETLFTFVLETAFFRLVFPLTGLHILFLLHIFMTMHIEKKDQAA